MRYNLLLLSDDTSLGERIGTALAEECTTVCADPNGGDYQALAQRFLPHGVLVDAGAHLGRQTTLEFIGLIRAQFPGTPLIILGDEMSAQSVLMAFRAGANEFLDRNASDLELHMVILPKLADHSAHERSRPGAIHFDILSAGNSEEDCDLALNIAILAAREGKRRALLVDLSLPSSAAHLALGLDPGLTIEAAIQQMRRLDEDFLESALAYSKEGAIHVLPLSCDGANTAAMPSMQDLLALFEIIGSAFDVVVVHWGAFSLQTPLVARGHKGRLVLVCNQRFSSVRNAKITMATLAKAGIEAPDVTLAIHLMAPGMPPGPEDIARAVGAHHVLSLPASWEAMARACNQGRPLSLQSASPYVDALRNYMARAAILEKRETETFNPIRHLLQKVRAR